MVKKCRTKVVDFSKSYWRRLTDWLIDWLIDYDGVGLCLRTAATNGPIVHSPGDMWAWRAMVMMMMMPTEETEDNSWLVHQSPLAVLPAEKSRASRRNRRRSENFAYQYLFSSLLCRKYLTTCDLRLYFPSECVLRIFVALKNPSPRPGLNPRPLGPVASTLTTTPPRRLNESYTFTLDQRLYDELLARGIDDFDLRPM
jgi:hypothetical protein